MVLKKISKSTYYWIPTFLNITKLQLTHYKYIIYKQTIYNPFYRFAIKAIKNPIVFITVLYVKNTFRKLTSNNKTITYKIPTNKSSVNIKKYWFTKKAIKSDIKNKKKIKNTTK